MTEQNDALVETPVSRETGAEDPVVPATEPTAEPPSAEAASVPAGAEGEADSAPQGSGPDDSTSASSESDGEGAAAEAVTAEGEGEHPRKRRSSVADLEREGEVAADFLETLLDIADLDGDIDVDVDGDRAAVSIVDSEEGRVPRRLVGTDGTVLEALQELTRLAVQSATGERSRLMLDVAGHRANRREQLVAVAREAIEKVKAGGEAVSLEPMSAFERKVVHDAVLDAGLASESDGVEPRRFVVVRPH